jgi:hypothetical protein
MLKPTQSKDERSALCEPLEGDTMDTSTTLHSFQSEPFAQRDLLHPIRQRLDRLEVRNAKTARWIAKLIPAQCPFERDVKLLGRTVAHIPPLCKLNPLYDQFVMLRFRALCYLADECGEDIRSYC